MPTLTTSAVQRPGIVAIRPKPPESHAARMTGLAIASVLPAVFWSALIEAALTWFGAPLSLLAVSLLCATIALFLTIACAPLILRRDA